MIKIRTTLYFKPQYGSLISKLRTVGFLGKEEILEYDFPTKISLYDWLRDTKLKIKSGNIYKGKTCIGHYLWEK